MERGLAVFVWTYPQNFLFLLKVNCICRSALDNMLFVIKKAQQHRCFFDACKCSLAGTCGLHSAFMAFCQLCVQCGCRRGQVKGVVQWLRACKTVLHRPDWEDRREKRRIYYDKSPIQALPPCSAYRYVIHICTRAYRDQAKYHVIPYISLPSQPLPSAQTRLHLTYNLVEPHPSPLSHLHLFLRLNPPPSTKPVVLHAT